jgi:hypothetical protein
MTLVRFLRLGLAVTFLSVTASDVFAKDKRGSGAAPKVITAPKASGLREGVSKVEQNRRMKEQVRNAQKRRE